VLLDPKAYFAQWQQAALTGQAALLPKGAPAAAVPAAPATSPSPKAAAPREEKSEMERQVEEVSAVRCAAIVKEKGDKFTTGVAIAALRTMATKSSFKLREELVKQTHVRKLCTRIAQLLLAPPMGLPFVSLASAAWSIARFPDDVRGDNKATFDATTRKLASMKGSAWDVETVSKLLWSLAKAQIIHLHKPLVSQIVKELVADEGRRAKELTHEGLMNLLWSVARARRHIQQGDHQTVHVEPNDEFLFRLAAARVTKELDTIDAKYLAELAHIHAEIGIRNEGLFKKICPRIIANQKDLREDEMGKAIKAYCRFMIPLREEAQGFRTMAIVAKGDFQRPSDKPEKKGKKVFDHPQALFPSTQLHQRA
jgi:hypothetical protein